MADLNVTYKMSGNSNDARRALAKLEQDYEKLTGKVSQITKRSKKGSKEATTGLGDMSRAAAGVAVSVIGIGSAIGVAVKGISLLKSEFDDLLERQRKAKQTQLTFVQAFDQAVLNLGPGEKADDLQKRIDRVSKATGASPQMLRLLFQPVFPVKAHCQPTNLKRHSPRF